MFETKIEILDLNFIALTQMKNSYNSTSVGGANSTIVQRNDKDTIFLILSVVFYLLIVVIGTTANVLLLRVFLCAKKLKDNEYLILNLVLTDLGSCVISIPLDATEKILDHFPFGEVLCKIVYPLQTVLMAVSVLTLLLMSYERYRLIVTPFKSLGGIRGKYWGCLILCTWTGASLFVLPYVLVLRLEGKTCQENWPDPRSSPIFTTCIFAVLYVIPLIVITLFYSRVALSMYNDNHRMLQLKAKNPLVVDQELIYRIKRNSRIVKVFVTAVIVFALCMLPTHIVWLWKEFSGRETRDFYKIATFCNILMYANCAIDPFVFGSIRIYDVFNCCKRELDGNTTSVVMRTHKKKENVFKTGRKFCRDSNFVCKEEKCFTTAL